MEKIKVLDDLINVLQDEKASGKIIGFTNGCFDILHVGHVKYLQDAGKNCDILVVGVNSDSSVKGLKGDDRPINDEFSRMEVLSGLECVNHVVLFNESTPENLIRSITPDILFKGGDWAEEDVLGGAYVKENGGKVKIISFVDGFSTTEIIEKIKDNNENS